MRTSSEALEGYKVKLTVEVDEEEILEAQKRTVRRLSREANLPGFRPGRVPERILSARLGKKAVREEVLREALPRYCSDAIEEVELDVISTPEIDITAGEDEGPVTFDAIVEVRPEVSVAGYEGLEITLDAPNATDQEIDEQITRMQDQFATLTEVTRAARDHDLVTLDVHGMRDGAPADGLTADDIVYEVGTAGIAEGVDARLFGAKVGEIFEMDAEDAPGGPADLRILVKQIREKVLPEANDEFASDASEFDTVEALRSDIASRISSMKRFQSNIDLRERSLDALANLVDVDPPESLVSHESEHLLESFIRRLGAQNVPLESYLSATGQEPEAFIEEIKTQARRQVGVDLALRALATAESIEVDESDIDEEIVRLAGQSNQGPSELRETLEQSGNLPGLRSQIKNAKAMTWLVEHISIVDAEGKSLERDIFALEGVDKESGPAQLVGSETVLAEME